MFLIAGHFLQDLTTLYNHLTEVMFEIRYDDLMLHKLILLDPLVS